MARRRREVEVFTTSSLNLLSKALGAVILLFIIIPKVSMDEKKRLLKLPPDLSMLLCDSGSIKLMRGDSVDVAFQIDSIQNNLKVYADLYEKLNCIKKHIHVVDTVYNKPKPPHPDPNITPYVPVPPPPVLPGPVVVNDCNNDKTPPVFSNCPSNIIKTTTSTSESVLWKTPVATDNCGTPQLNSIPTTSPTAGLNNGMRFPVGTTGVTYTATDLKGNQGHCTFTVTVNGTIQGRTPDIKTKTPPEKSEAPVFVRLRWTGDENARLDVSAIHNGQKSGAINFGDDTKWMRIPKMSRKASEKILKQTQKDGLFEGTFDILVRLKSDKNIELEGFASLNTPQSECLDFTPIPKKTISKGNNDVKIGTITVTKTSITFSN